MISPKLSIVTVTLNADKELNQTLASIFSQTYKDYELIIIDGGSTDSTLEIIKQNKDKITFWISEKDQGIYDAMNKGLQIAKGEYLQFLNGGDFFPDSNVLSEVFSNLIDTPTLIYGDINVKHLNGNTHYQKADKFIFKNILEKGTATICHQAIFVKRSHAPFYNINYTFKGELNWYFDLVEIPDFLYKYIKIPIVVYSLGGFGHKHFIKNRVEWLKVIYNRYGLMTVFKSKIILFLLKNSRYRYPLMDKIFKIYSRMGNLRYSKTKKITKAIIKKIVAIKI